MRPLTISEESERAESGSLYRTIDDDLRTAREAINRQFESWDGLRRTVLTHLNEQACTTTSLSGRIDRVDQTIKAISEVRRGGSSSRTCST